jgi:hypothetical protein
MPLADIDTLYVGFCDSLPDEIRPVARGLAHRLGLTPMAGVPWSEVFGHEVTLAAPALVAEALPRVEPEAIRFAVLAHLLAVIEAFGADRLADGQVAPEPALAEVLAELRRARDDALRRVDARASYQAADDHSRASMASEREWLAGVRPAAYADYARLSLGKQAVGSPASLALARSAGATARELGAIERLLGDVWLALQHHDDVVDWEDDWKRGGAWAVCLARGSKSGESSEPATEPDVVRRYVLRSGVLALLLGRARRHYRGAWRRARALGAWGLATWAEGRMEQLADLTNAEKASAGHAVRVFRLAPWAAEVLS